MKKIIRITAVDMDTGRTLYDDHPTAGIVSLAHSYGTETFCINENDDPEYLALAAAGAARVTSDLLADRRGFRKIFRCYRRILKRSKVILKNESKNQEEEQE